LVDLSLNRFSTDIPLIANEVRDFPIFGIIYYFWKFYQNNSLEKIPTLDRVNPGSVILSGEMMFRYLGRTEAADLIIKGLNCAISSKRVTYDFARLMDDATQIKCSEFGDNMIFHF